MTLSVRRTHSLSSGVLVCTRTRSAPHHLRRPRPGRRGLGSRLGRRADRRCGVTEPPSVRIAAELRAQIERGELAPGERVPSAREITRRWGVAIATATRVLAALRDDGLVRADSRGRHRRRGAAGAAQARRRADRGGAPGSRVVPRVPPARVGGTAPEAGRRDGAARRRPHRRGGRGDRRRRGARRAVDAAGGHASSARPDVALPARHRQGRPAPADDGRRAARGPAARRPAAGLAAAPGDGGPLAVGGVPAAPVAGARAVAHPAAGRRGRARLHRVGAGGPRPTPG